jgi:hypothetical protein
MSSNDCSPPHAGIPVRSSQAAALKETRQGIQTQDRGNEPKISFRFNKCSEKRTQSCGDQSPGYLSQAIRTGGRRGKGPKLKIEETNPKSPLDSTNVQKDEPKPARGQITVPGQIVALKGHTGPRAELREPRQVIKSHHPVSHLMGHENAQQCSGREQVGLNV